MSSQAPLPKDKKLAFVFRVEPGCLGPDGLKKIAKFCDFAHDDIESIDSNFVHWEIVPRFDKSLPEMELMIGDKSLSREKAARYLQAFDKDLDVFEEHFHDRLTSLIEEYIKRQS